MRGFYIAILVGILALSSVACSQSYDVTTLEGPATIVTSPDDISETDSPLTPELTTSDEAMPSETLAPPAALTLIPTITPQIAAVVSDECLNCHSDKDRLIETSATVEVAPSESSGVG